MKTVVILCGGKNLRLKGNFDNVPKPLILIEGKPLIEYIINQYTQYGIEQVLLLVGHNEELFIEFANKFTNKKIKIKVVQTGLDTPTGGRIKAAEFYLKNYHYFFLTYGDGIANVNIKQQLDFHLNHEKIASLTTVQPQLPFGLLKLNEE